MTLTHKILAISFYSTFAYQNECPNTLSWHSSCISKQFHQRGRYICSIFVRCVNNTLNMSVIPVWRIGASWKQTESRALINDAYGYGPVPGFTSLAYKVIEVSQQVSKCLFSAVQLLSTFSSEMFSVCSAGEIENNLSGGFFRYPPAYVRSVRRLQLADRSKTCVSSATVAIQKLKLALHYRAIVSGNAILNFNKFTKITSISPIRYVTSSLEQLLCSWNFWPLSWTAKMLNPDPDFIPPKWQTRKFYL